MKLLVVGCGGIGGVIAGHLLEQGHALCCATHHADIATTLRERGFELRDEHGTRVITGEVLVHEQIPRAGRFDFVLLCTQPNQVEAAARDAAPLLSERGAMVCFQNGLCEERVARIVGRERVIGAIVAWGASALAPGVYERTSSGGFTVGTLDGSRDDRVQELARILEALGPVDITRNLAGSRWSKLALNCAISSLGTIGGARLGAIMIHRHVRRLGLELMSEATAVARAEGVRLEKVSGTIDLDWLALTPEERAAERGTPSLLAKHALLLAVGARYRRLRSSMLAAIERGREPPVDFLNGEIVERAGRHRLDVPVNAAVQELVHAIARRERSSSLDTLRWLYHGTRTFARAAA